MITTKRQLLQKKAELRNMNLESERILESIVRRKERIEQDQKRFEKLENQIFFLQNEINTAEPQLVVSGHLFG